jgi:hypothetical protein
MSTINSRQNEKRQLQRLAAQRQLYSTSKRVMGFQLILGGPLAALTALAGFVVPSLKEYVALWGFLVLLLDLFWFTGWQKRLKESAAKIQEQFDCHVLALNWNTLKAGEPEAAETVLEQSTRYQLRAYKLPTLENWYPTEADQVPLNFGRLICQRANCAWDGRQRRAYAVAGSALLFALCAIGVTAGLVARLSVADMLLIIVVPLSSTFALGIRHLTEHREAADRLDRQRIAVEKLCREAIKSPKQDLSPQSRALQDEIFEGRRRHPLIFDWTFKWFRDKNQTEMQYGAADLVAQTELTAPTPDSQDKP